MGPVNILRGVITEHVALSVTHRNAQSIHLWVATGTDTQRTLTRITMQSRFPWHSGRERMLCPQQCASKVPGFTALSGSIAPSSECEEPPPPPPQRLRDPLIPVRGLHPPT